MSAETSGPSRMVILLSVYDKVGLCFSFLGRPTCSTCTVQTGLREAEACGMAHTRGSAANGEHHGTLVSGAPLLSAPSRTPQPRCWTSSESSRAPATPLFPKLIIVYLTSVSVCVHAYMHVCVRVSYSSRKWCWWRDRGLWTDRNHGCIPLWRFVQKSSFNSLYASTRRVKLSLP